MVRGCQDSDAATLNCPTNGGTVITISGSNFRSGMTVDVGGKACTSVTETDGVLTCLLPAGTGVLQLISVSLVIANGDGETTETLTSTGVYLIGYAAPSVDAISHTSCSRANSSVLSSLKECPRAGGGTLTVTGSNLGSEGAVVLIGIGVCDQLTHLSSSEVHCELSAGN